MKKNISGILTAVGWVWFERFLSFRVIWFVRAYGVGNISQSDNKIHKYYSVKPQV